ncbi:type II secretion system protein GspM [Pseudomonas putida]|uniref:type II secretion system protein GspM n=1 Tax=Pseudomonas putida TaxID=303 RepID=UPI001A8D076E|nr:type II secretion system protein GspM [Pseudomonas putida]MBO0365958.1 type II secretion system protein GspM [Pseudomonas putida]
MDRQRLHRNRMPLACGLIALLLLALASRTALAHWGEMRQWQALAESAASLQQGAPVSLERLRQSAQVRQVRLLDVEPRDGLWQLRGQVADEQHLQQWLAALQADGVQLLQWGLERDPSGLRFELQVQP